MHHDDRGDRPAARGERDDRHRLDVVGHRRRQDRRRPHGRSARRRGACRRLHRVLRRSGREGRRAYRRSFRRREALGHLRRRRIAFQPPHHLRVVADRCGRKQRDRRGASEELARVHDGGAARMAARGHLLEQHRRRVDLRRCEHRQPACHPRRARLRRADCGSCVGQPHGRAAAYGSVGDEQDVSRALLRRRSGRGHQVLL